MAASTVPRYPYADPARSEPAPGPDPLSEANTVRKMGVLMSLAFVFLYISRITDLRLSYLHLPFVIASLAGAAAVLSGCLPGALKTRAGMIYGAMTAWICLGTPFSVWRSGSVGVITQSWLRSVLISLLVLSLVASFKEVGYLMDTIALGVLFAALLGLRAGVASVDGRLEIATQSRISNPNDLAFVMLLGMPLWWRNLTSGGLFRRCAAAIALLPILACFLKTGSRAGLFALAVMMLVAFLRASPAGKIKIAVAASLAAAIGLAALPPHLRERYFTFETADMRDVNSAVGERAVGIAAASAIQRKNNLIDSIRMTLDHPLFGVGAGNFTVAQDQDAKAAGLRKGSWLGTHNTYTQLSSECGIPMLVLFLALLVASMRALGAARRLATHTVRPHAAGIRTATQATELLMWGTCGFIFFSHIGYDMTIYLLVSLCLVLARAAGRELGTGTIVAPAPAVFREREGRPGSGQAPRGGFARQTDVALSARMPISGAALRRASRRAQIM